MPILVSCSACSKMFRAQDEAAGQSMPCPHCQQTTSITGPAVSPFDAFVSYSSKDKTIADAAVATLEAKGVRCWIAPRDITPGKEWSEAIIEGIQQSRMMVLVFSNHANSSQQVLREVERAVNRGMPIVPFRIENLLPSKAMEYFISTHHWLDAYHPPLEEHLDKLTNTCESLLTGTVATREEKPKDLKGLLRSAVKTLAARDNRTRVLVGAAALLLLVGVLIVGAIYAMKDPKASPDVIQARAQAVALGEKLTRIDREQGFAQPLDEVNQRLKTGETLFGEKKFDQAKTEFDAVLSQGNELIQRDDHRQAVHKAREDLQVAVARGQTEKLPDAAPVAWARIVQAQQEADRAFQEGDFSTSLKNTESAQELLAAAKQEAANAGGLLKLRDALRSTLALPVARALETDSPADFAAIQKLMSTAADAHARGRSVEAMTNYRDAEKLLHVATLPRKKALALRLGFACCHLEIADAAAKWKPAPGFDIPIKKGANEYGIDASAWSRIVEEECKKQLDLDGEAIDRFLRQPGSSKLLNDIADALSRAPNLGPDVMVAFWLGSDLATIKIFTEAWTSGPSDVFRLFNTNRGRMPNYAGMIPYVHRSGAPAELLGGVLNPDEIDNTPAVPSRGGLTRPGTGSQRERRLRDIMQKVYDEHLSTTERATQFFWRFQKNQPTIAGKEAEIQQLRDRGANLYFHGDANNRKLIAVAFPPTATDEALAPLKSFDGVQYLWLTDSPVTDTATEIIREMTSLEQLSLSRTKVTEAGAKKLGSLSKLTNLYLNGLPITDDFVETLKEFKSLKRIYLANTKMTSAGFKALQEGRSGIVIAR